MNTERSGINDGLTGLRLDAAALKVLAHPLRSRLVSALRRGGPATATDLAAQLETNSGATSYHLRKLESVGLVTDTGEGEGKRRLWEAASESHQWDASDFAGDEDSETALNWLVRDYSHQLADRFGRWLDVEAAWPIQWRDAIGMNDTYVTVAAAQLRQMTAEIGEVVDRYRTAGEGNPDARQIATYSVTFPIELDDIPEDRS